MKKTIPSKAVYIILLCTLFHSRLIAQNAFINDGAAIQLESGAAIYIQGTLENKTTGSFTNNGVIYISGDLVHNGTVNLNATAAGSFRLNGTVNQLLSGTKAPDFYNLIIDKASGYCQLGTNITLSNQLTFTSGNIFLNNYQVDLLTTGTLINEGTASHIYDLTTGTGTVKIVRTLNAPSAVDPGNLGAVITSSQNMGSTTIIRGHEAQMIVSSNGIGRYYDITPSSNTSLNATLRFNYFDSELNGQPEDELAQWHLPAGSAVWQKRLGTLNTSSNYVELAGVDSFNSRISLISHKISPMPVKLLEFTAVAIPQKKVQVSWKTIDEVMFSHFDVERSSDGLRWTKIGEVAAAGGSGILQSYGLTDQSPMDTYNYYRLKMVDIDHQFKYSVVRMVRFDNKTSVHIYPTIAKPGSQLFVMGISPEKAIVELYDNKGRLLLKTTLPGNSLLLPQLPGGIYHVKVVDQKDRIVAGTTQLVIY